MLNTIKLAEILFGYLFFLFFIPYVAFIYDK